MIENCLVGHGQKWVWPILSYLENEQIELTDFLHAGTIYAN